MTVTDTQRKLAHAAGRMAARLGRPLAQTCPYKPSRSARDRVLALWFVRGYRSAQPPGSGVSYS